MSEYNKGYNQGLEDMAKRLKCFYHRLSGKTVGGSVAYHIEQIKGDLMRDICVSCGADVPEGRQVCPNCERKVDEYG